MKLLDVYYCIDLGDNQDINFVIKCLEIYIKTKCNEYTLNRFEKYEIINDKDKHKDKEYKIDIIKDGLDTFNDMFKNLKLKSSDKTKVWFFYISNGNIGEKYKDISLILLNTNPMIKKANYVINKNIIDVNTNYTKENKLNGTKCLTGSLTHLFNSNKTIEYM
jgi:hypothetical protein